MIARKEEFEYIQGVSAEQRITNNLGIEIDMAPSEKKFMRNRKRKLNSQT